MPSSPRSAAGVATACAAVLGLGLTGLVALTGTAGAATTNLVVNPGFETGTLANWTCDAGTTSVVTSPVHSGSHALAGAATSSDDAQCTQTISVQPSSTYSLSAWVQGKYVYLGTTGDGTTDDSTWSDSSAWNQLTDSFTTGASTTSVTVYLHGWYGQGTYYADDVSLTGAAGSSPSASASASASPTGSASPTATPTATSTSSPSGTMGGFAPYVDMTQYPQYDLVTGASTEGTKDFNLAFITDGGTCDPEWGGVTALNDPATLSDVQALQAEGGVVRVSFGGENGNEIAMDCTSLSSLVAAYQSVISDYSLKYIDFDIEGAAVDDRRQQPAQPGHRPTGDQRPGPAGLLHPAGTAHRSDQRRTGSPAVREDLRRLGRGGEPHGHGLRCLVPWRRCDARGAGRHRHRCTAADRVDDAELRAGTVEDRVDADDRRQRRRHLGDLHPGRRDHDGGLGEEQQPGLGLLLVRDPRQRVLRRRRGLGRTGLLLGDPVSRGVRPGDQRGLQLNRA